MKELLKKRLSEHLSEQETKDLFDSFMIQDESPAVGANRALGANGALGADGALGAYLYSTAMLAPSVAELVGGVRSLREHMVPLRASEDEKAASLLDTCGTGGSGLDTFNTSTASAFVCAAHGQAVAKHGNRAATSRCGSADVLEHLGVVLELSPEQELECLEKTNFCFMYAPLHHPATKKVVLVRRQIGVRTIFNFLGPLSNPAGAQFQIVGVSDSSMMNTIAEALHQLGSNRVLVVRGQDGLDEISPCAPTDVIELKEGKLSRYTISPGDFGLEELTPAQIVGGEAKDSSERLKRLLKGADGPLRTLVALNAGAGLYVSGNTATIAEGVAKALEILESGKAHHVLQSVISWSKNLK